MTSPKRPRHIHCIEPVVMLYHNNGKTLPMPQLWQNFIRESQLVRDHNGTVKEQEREIKQKVIEEFTNNTRDELLETTINAIQESVT